MARRHKRLQIHCIIQRHSSIQAGVLYRRRDRIGIKEIVELQEEIGTFFLNETTILREALPLIGAIMPIGISRLIEGTLRVTAM